MVFNEIYPPRLVYPRRTCRPWLARLAPLAHAGRHGIFPFPQNHFARETSSDQRIKDGCFRLRGRPWATINIRKDCIDGTVGVPGSGLSYKERLANRGCVSLLAFVLLTVSLVAAACMC